MPDGPTLFSLSKPTTELSRLTNRNSFRVGNTETNLGITGRPTSGPHGGLPQAHMEACLKILKVYNWMKEDPFVIEMKKLRVKENSIFLHEELDFLHCEIKTKFLRKQK